MLPKFSVTYGPPMGLWPILILAIFASKIRNCVLILQRYNLFELSIQSRLCTRYEVYNIIVLWVLCGCAHFRGLTSQRAAQCNGILISILVFPIKSTLHETFVACINSNTTLVRVYAYLYFPFFLRSLPIDLPTVSVCYVHLYSILHILHYE